MKILDTSIRDGGYLNKWQWPEEVFKNIVESLYGKVDIIEIGYRRPGRQGFEYCDDEYISNLLGKEYDNLALMIDCKDYLWNHKANHSLLYHNFSEKVKETPVTYIRCACDIKHLEQSIEITKHLDSIGYKTTINIMKYSLLLEEGHGHRDRIFFYYEKGKMDHLEYLYFADSFGCIDYNHYAKVGRLQMGFHPHNNKNLAFSLYQEISKENHYYEGNEENEMLISYNIIDSSIAGIGRGAGNLDTIQVLMDRNHSLDNGLYKCLKYIERIKKESQCGYSYEYHYCAINNIHPNYCVYLKDLHKYGRYEIIEILGKIETDKRQSFDIDYLKGLLK